MKHTDPFAVGTYDLRLPVPPLDQGADTLALRDFAPLWLADLARRIVGNEQDVGAAVGAYLWSAVHQGKGLRTPGAVGDRAPFTVTFEQAGREFSRLPIKKSDRDAKRLALAAYLVHGRAGPFPEAMPPNVHRALRATLGLEKRAAMRAKALRVASLWARALVQGQNKTQAARTVALAENVSASQLWAYDRHSAQFRLVLAHEVVRWRKGNRFQPQAYPRAADAWFSAGADESVAAQIYAAASEGWTLPLRWDLINLVEGHDRRRQPMSAWAERALLSALGLVDRAGAPSNLPLDGVRDRIGFMDALEAYRRWPVAWTGYQLAQQVDSNSQAGGKFNAWIDHPLFVALRAN